MPTHEFKKAVDKLIERFRADLSALIDDEMGTSVKEISKALKSPISTIQPPATEGTYVLINNRSHRLSSNTKVITGDLIALLVGQGQGRVVKVFEEFDWRVVGAKEEVPVKPNMVFEVS